MISNSASANAHGERSGPPVSLSRDASISWLSFADPAPIVVVSGLPRSGTSMVMRMLEAGGLEIVTDGVRVADDSNPRGYYEDERVKRLESRCRQVLAQDRSRQSDQDDLVPAAGPA